MESEKLRENNGWILLVTTSRKVRHWKIRQFEKKLEKLPKSLLYDNIIIAKDLKMAKIRLFFKQAWKYFQGHEHEEMVS